MPSRYHILPILLVTLGVIIACATTLLVGGLGWWSYLVYAGGTLSLLGLIWFKRQLTSGELEILADKTKLASEKAKLKEQRSEFEKTRKETEEFLRDHLSRLDNRHQSLTKKLIAFQSFLEFPEPIDLSGDPTEEAKSPEEQKADLSDLAKKDREVFEILDAESKTIYNNILYNRYADEQGVFDPLKLWEEAVELMTKVARVYNPDAENPLLETSMEKLLRSASRACLHFLVVMEQLPLGVQKYNVNRMYNYIHRAVQAFGTYKATQPYTPFLSGAYNIGRLALGANPVVLGAWYAIGEIGKRGAGHLAKKFVDRQAIALLYDAVRVIGQEMASIYGEDFRYRDPNWIYGAELTDLMRRFPVSRDNLSQSMKEVGGLELRNEYDRIYLYRCLAAHKSARPQRGEAAEVLPIDQRQRIARRLEKFFAAFIHGKTPAKVAEWKQEVEERLDLKLNVNSDGAPQSHQAAIDNAVQSLASFLLEVKEREPDELDELLSMSQLFYELPAEDKQKVLARLKENPPYIYEQPDLDPDGEVTPRFLDDLTTLAALRPLHQPLEELVSETAAYLRQNPSRVQKQLDQKLIAHLSSKLGEDAPRPRFPGPVAQAALAMLEGDEWPLFVYSHVTFEWTPGVRRTPFPKNSLWLYGTDRRLLVLAHEDGVRPVWQADETVSCEPVRGMFVTDARLDGGRWLPDEDRRVPAVRIAGSVTKGYEAYFAPLLEKVDSKPPKRVS